MGGKLLNGRRINKNEYIVIRTKAVKILRDYISNICLDAGQFSDKDWFGDIDLFSFREKSNDIYNILSSITDFSNVTQTSYSTFSFLFQGVQIDLSNLITFNDFRLATAYASFGDAGMFYGRLSRVYDLKFGFDGLEYVYRQDEKEVERFRLSGDFTFILRFLGYPQKEIEYIYSDYQRSTYKEIADFLFSSNRIDQRFLLADSENTKHRKRDKLRPFFAELYSYMQTNRTKFPPISRFSIPGGEAGIDYIESWFPDSRLLSEIDEFKTNRETLKKAKRHFNGGHVLAAFPTIKKETLNDIIKKWEYSIFSSTIVSNNIQYKLMIANHKLSKTKTDLICEFGDVIKNMDFHIV